MRRLMCALSVAVLAVLGWAGVAGAVELPVLGLPASVRIDGQACPNGSSGLLVICRDNRSVTFSP